jgi:outer membrane lipoprotein SlyB
LAKLVTADETKKDVGGTIGGAIGGTSGGIIGNTVGGPVVGYIVGALTGISGTQALETIGQNYELCGGAATVPAFP